MYKYCTLLKNVTDTKRFYFLRQPLLVSFHIFLQILGPMPELTADKWQFRC